MLRVTVVFNVGSSISSARRRAAMAML